MITWIYITLRILGFSISKKMFNIWGQWSVKRLDRAITGNFKNKVDNGLIPLVHGKGLD